MRSASSPPTVGSTTISNSVVITSMPVSIARLAMPRSARGTMLPKLRLQRDPSPAGFAHHASATGNLGRVAQGWFEVANAQPGQGRLYPVHNPRAFPHQAVALAVWPLGVLFVDRRHASHGAVAPFAPQPPQEPALQQLGVEPVG